MDNWQDLAALIGIVFVVLVLAGVLEWFVIEYLDKRPFGDDL